MKKLAFLLIGLITLSTALASTHEATRYNRAVYDGSKYIFVENGIEFSVFPDGEFDFYIPQYVDGVNVGVNAGPLAISFNTGFDYDPYIQYDNYGAVIQIENTPLYYDNYGRLIQAGDVFINYRRNRISRVGGLYVHYNNFGTFTHVTGFINPFNRYYVYSPFHTFFYRPVFNRCLVWTTPYRRFYTPVRYNYAYHRNNYWRGYANGYVNGRRDFRRPETGRVAHNNGRRDNLDRNNARFQSVSSTSNSARRGVVSSDSRKEKYRTIHGKDPKTSRGYISTNEKDSRLSRKDPRTNRGHISNSAKVDRRVASTSSRKEKYDRSNKSRGYISKGRTGSSTSKATSRTHSSRPSATKRSSSRSSKSYRSSTSNSNRSSVSRPSSSRSKANYSKRSSSPSRASKSTNSRSYKSSRGTSNNSSKSSRSTRSKRG